MNLSKIIYNWCFCVQKIGNDIHVVPNKIQRNSVRNLMCVGRYAEKM